MFWPKQPFPQSKGASLLWLESLLHPGSVCILMIQLMPLCEHTHKCVQHDLDIEGGFAHKSKFLMFVQSVKGLRSCLGKAFSLGKRSIWGSFFRSFSLFIISLEGWPAVQPTTCYSCWAWLGNHSPFTHEGSPFDFIRTIRSIADIYQYWSIWGKKLGEKNKLQVYC